MLRQTTAFGLIRAENLPGSIMVSALLIFILMIERVFLHCEKKEAKWREKVERVQPYRGDCRARWKIVIGGSSDISSILLCS